MYRDDLEIATTDVHNFVLNHGALGDVICSLPAMIHARLSHNAQMKMKVHCANWQADLLKHLLAPYGEFEVLDIADFPKDFATRRDLNVGPVSINQMPFNTHTRNRVHMVDYAFGCLIDAKPESMSQRSYPTLAPIGPLQLELFDASKGYVVFPVGATSDNKLFRASVMTPILRWVLDNGYDAMLVGTKVSHTRAEMGDGNTEKLVIRDQADMVPADLIARCIDMREKTTLLELRDICGHAKAVVGVDGGTLHLAGTTDTNIIYAMGTTHPKHRYIARLGDHNHKIKYVVPRDLACTGCQSNWTMTSLDFRFCAYGDNLCMEKLHHEDFIDGLKELGL